MDLFGRLFATLGLRAREASVPGRDPPEPPLARPELGPRAVLHPLDLELDVLVAERTVTADTLGHLHGGATEHRYRGELLFEGSWVAADFSTKRRWRGAKIGLFEPETRAIITVGIDAPPVESQEIYIAKLINGGELH